MDHLASGFAPTAGPADLRRRVHDMRQRRVNELQRLRDTLRRRGPPRQPLTGAVLASQHTHPRPNGIACLQKGERQVAVDYTLFHALRDEDSETLRLAAAMLEKYQLDRVDPLEAVLAPCAEDEMSSEEEYNAELGLDYCPRRKFDVRHIDAFCMIAISLGEIDARAREEERASKALKYAQRPVPEPHTAVMRRVMAQLQDVIKTTETVEIGPAPHGFSYLQLGEEIYLVADNGDGSMVYMSQAQDVFIRRRP
ncbi:hypothetical protein B0H17DRAFT_1136375 [Mycena rosella]|uniref:Uncharacterized protein n=1 Tax=Mycena rosella TaxID=1033263 RepID=A0AAD7DBE0_MYCRO|nr:hypothetical protein B0H17DRAFT_1136375 [Mycena rosella]